MTRRSDFIRSLILGFAGPVALSAQSPRPFNLLVLGDSISWGQGLLPEHRWRTLLCKQLEQTLKRPVNAVATEIHSGATIGVGDHNQIDDVNLYQPDAATPEPSFLADTAYGGEIPSSTPTILRQFDSFYASNKTTPIDLIVISAGINDVQLLRFLMPGASSSSVARLIDLHCHKHLLVLLDRIRAVCIAQNPACHVVVLSYFNILSTDSTAIPFSILEFIEAFLSAPHLSPSARLIVRGTAALAKIQDRGSSPARVKAAAAGKTVEYSSLPLIVRAMVTNAARFYAASEVAIHAAVTEENAKAQDGHTSFVHVTPKLDISQSLYVPNNESKLWEVLVSDKHTDPTDEVVQHRDEACRTAYGTDTDALQKCHIASFGHPDREGAHDGYFNAIWEAVSPWLPSAN